MSQAFRMSGIKDDDRKKIARFVEADFSKSPSLTVQAPSEEVDINKIISRLIKGQTIITSAGQPFYGDVSEFDGLQDALIKVQEADELFMQFPADLREKFENDPVKFVDFMSDPKNTDEAVKLGLAYKKPVPEPANPGTSPAPVAKPGSTQ